jgi:3',5'-cyclic AMP phosphodiesterase CpdA
MYNMSIPDYYESHLSAVTDKVKGLQSADMLIFIFITDLHHEPGGNQLHAARALGQLAGSLTPDFIVCGGDISLNGDKLTVLAAQREIMDELGSNACPMLPVKGNHDDNSIVDFYQYPDSVGNVIFPEETYELGFRKLEGEVSFDEGNPAGMYYYYDLPEKKTRIVILNAIDIPYHVTEKGNLRYSGQFKYAFSDRQLQWTAHKALLFSDKTEKAGWRVLLFSHIPILQEGIYGTDHGVTNDTVMWGILKAFQSGTAYRSVPTTGDFSQSIEVDFTRQGRGKLAACFFGHVHFDQSLQKDGITMVTTLNAATQQDFEEAPARVSGTVTETAFDVVTVDFSERTIFTVRFGAGEDRRITFR